MENTQLVILTPCTATVGVWFGIGIYGCFVTPPGYMYIETWPEGERMSVALAAGEARPDKHHGSSPSSSAADNYYAANSLVISGFQPRSILATSSILQSYE